MNLESQIDNIIYHALFVKDIQKLKELFPPVHPNTFYHHSTIQFKPKSLEGLNIGEKSKLKIWGRLTTDKVDVLIVDNKKSTNEYPHITLSTAEGIKPFESNSEIKYNINDVEYFENLYIDVEENVLWKK